MTLVGFVDSFSSCIGTPNNNHFIGNRQDSLTPKKKTSTINDGAFLFQYREIKNIIAPLVKSIATTTRLSLSQPKQYSDGNKIVFEVEEYLAERYPMYTNMILRKNENLWKKQLDQAVVDNGGFTIFVLTDKWLTQNVVTNEKIIVQLQDQRNLETLEKISLYHTINEIVTYEDLCNAGGIQTMGGIVPIEEKSKGNGIFGMFGNNNNKKSNNDKQQDDNLLDAPITVNGANIIRYYMIGNECHIYEIDNLISPKLLWRYMDQLRIPGTK